jgi:hypothetical protein
MDMEILNHDYEIKLREGLTLKYEKDIEDIRRTIQPEKEWDEDHYETRRRLTVWQY